MEPLSISLNFIEELAILRPILYKRYWTRLKIVFNNFSHSTADFAYCGCLGELFRNQSSSILSQNVVYFCQIGSSACLKKLQKSFTNFLLHLPNSHIFPPKYTNLGIVKNSTTSIEICTTEILRAEIPQLNISKICPIVPTLHLFAPFLDLLSPRCPCWHGPC